MARLGGGSRPRGSLILALLAAAGVAGAEGVLAEPSPTSRGDGSEATVPALGPEWLTLDSPIRGDLRTLAIRGLLPLGALTVEPGLRAQIAAADTILGLSARRLERELANSRPLVDTPIGRARLRLRPYVWFEGRWQGGNAAVWGDSPRVGVAGTLHLSPRLSLHEDLFAGDVEDGRRFGDALVNHTDFLLFLESAHLTYARDEGFVRLGRFRHAWGPGRFGNLLVAPSAQPFDQVEYGLEFGAFRFRSITGTLDPGSEKNIALHRLEWLPHPRWLLAVSEGAVFHGTPTQPLYLIGLVPYSVLERVHSQDVFRSRGTAVVRNNVLVEADLLFRWRENAALWGEMLVDDVGTESSEHPTRLGFLLGSEAELTRGGVEWNVGLEAAKIYDFVYSVYYEDSDWTHQERPLGFALGPDSESLRGFLHWRPVVDWEVGVDLILERHGEGRLGQPWYPFSDPRSEANPDSSPSELRGTVERLSAGALELSWFPSASLRTSIRMTLTRVENALNEPGVERDDAQLDLSVRWRR